ncbi:MAG TPA: hypothetical protein VHZ95_02305, partial [Polyangiales bacterium]|nr:hypothetical protein [Polyangiales bacterium]
MNALLKLGSALLSIGIAFGMNRLARPRFEPHYADSDYADSAGSLSLSHAGGTLEIPLMVTHIVTTDVARFGRAFKVRELTLRAAGSGRDAPRIELFASLLDSGGDLIDGAHDPS